MIPVYGIIGCGNISKFHFESLKKAGAKIACVSDLDVDIAEKYAKDFNAKYYSDYHKVIDDDNVTAIYVLASGRLHKQMCIEALNKGKDVICEKTMTDSADEAYEVVNAVKSNKQLFFTAYMKRFFPATKKVLEILPSLGKVFSMYVRSYQPWEGNLFNTKSIDNLNVSNIFANYGGAILKCAGSHVLDLMMCFMGCPNSVFAHVDYIGDSKFDRKATALFEFNDGATAVFEAAAHPLMKIGYENNGWDERIEINGVNGRLNLYTVMWDHPENNGALLEYYDNKTQTTTHYHYDAVNPFHIETEYFKKCLEDRIQGKPNVIDGYNVDVVIESIAASNNSKQRIDINWKSV